MITNIFGSVFSSLENMINDFDGNSYPIKKSIIGELSRSLIGNSQTTTDANLRIFYKFIQFAYKTHLYTANASLVDLFIAFLHGAEQGFFLEIGYSADRENSVTLFLEAYAGWRGVIVDDEIVDNLSIKALRRVEICSVNSFYESVVDASIDLLCVHNRNYIDSVISFLEGGRG